MTKHKTDLPVPSQMDQLIAIYDQAACDESAEYVLAAALSGAADQAGLAPDRDDFETRCNQRKMFMGRIIEIIRERGLLSPQSAPAPDAQRLAFQEKLRSAILSNPLVSEIDLSPALDTEQGDRCRDCGSTEAGNCFYCKAD